MPCSACGGRRATARRRRARPSASASGATSLDRAVGLLGRPAEPDQPGLHLRLPVLGARRGRVGEAASVVGVPMRSRSSRMIRWAPFWPMPGTMVSVFTSSLLDRPAQRLRGVAGQHGLRELGADAAGRLDAARTSASRRRRRSRRGSGSPRAPPGSSAAWPRRRSAGRPACRGCTAARGRPRRPRARPRSGPTAATRPRTNAITGWLLAPPARPRLPRAGVSRPRARCGRWPARASRRRRRACGTSSSRSRRVTIAPTWALSARPLPVTAALTSLGVCRATGMPAAGSDQDGDAAGLSGAHDRAHVVLAEDPLDRDGVGARVRSSHSSSPRSIWHSRWSMGRSAAVRTTPDRDQSSAAGPRTPRPRRRRTGSGRGRRRARALDPPAVVRTPVRTTLTAPRSVVRQDAPPFETGLRPSSGTRSPGPGAQGPGA